MEGKMVSPNFINSSLITEKKRFGNISTEKEETTIENQ